MQRFTRFALVGGSAFLLDAALLALLHRGLGLEPITARLPGFLIVTAYTWLANRRFTFAATVAPSFAEFAHYLTGAAFGIAVNWAVYGGLVLWVAFCARWPVTALVPATAAAMLFNFAWYSRLYRRRTLDAGPPSSGKRASRR